ncbi:hypothetical protein AAG570_012875 [Ranatra chinensis]|uniref:Uncharacterized protein n=1 Tax=Ranatra chinensis TaxID=642074 RepID=A0ABD0YF48_9HEMI
MTTLVRSGGFTLKVAFDTDNKRETTERFVIFLKARGVVLGGPSIQTLSAVLGYPCERRQDLRVPVRTEDLHKYMAYGLTYVVRLGERQREGYRAAGRPVDEQRKLVVLPEEVMAPLPIGPLPAHLLSYGSRVCGRAPGATRSADHNRAGDHRQTTRQPPHAMRHLYLSIADSRTLDRPTDSTLTLPVAD